MKTSIFSIIKKALPVFFALAVIISFGSVKTAFADKDYGWGEADFGDSSYYYDEYYPIYEYDTYYPSYDYDTYYPSYDYDYPSYSYDSYAPSYSSYTPSSYIPSSGCGSSCGGSTPRYVPTSGGGSPQYQYVYSSNTNTNTAVNTNTNNIVNTFNPTNNNDINVVVMGGGGGTTNPPVQQNLEGNCYISPSTVYVNQDVNFSATASGGNGSYTYQWSGDNGINSSSQSFTGRFSYPGYKTATVVIRSGNQSITRTCNTTVQDNYNQAGAYCVATPSNAGLGQTVTWTAYVTGGSYGSGYAYSYSWTGSDGLYGNGQTISRTYNAPGYKTATVTAYVNGQTISATCATTINAYGGATVIRDQNLGTPVSGIYLSQVPATGMGLGLKTGLFSAGILAWSAFAAYMIARKSKKPMFAIAGGSLAGAFKLRNMKSKGIAA